MLHIPPDELGDRLTVEQLLQACEQIDANNAEAEKARSRR